MPATERTTLRRLPARGAHDRATIDAILDEGLICHLGFVDQGKPAVIPTGYARDGDFLYLHGSLKNRALRAVVGRECCVEVTLLNGIVLARSAFHHSFNYRSVVIYGRGEEVVDEAEKQRAFERVVEHIVPGRAADCRMPNAKESAATLVVKIPIDESSAKIRTGAPKDDPEDVDLPVWAGVVPVRDAWGPAEPDNAPGEDRAEPDYVKAYSRP